MQSDENKETSLEVRLTVNGKRVPIKQFVKDILGGAVLGMVETLRGAEEPHSVVIEVDKAK